MPAGVELRETHISWVLLGRDRVLKLKKPVNFGFLDFSTLDRRRQACDAEVALNERLAPGVYVGVVPISRSPGAPHRVGEPSPLTNTGADAEVVEWGVLMRRLPDADRGDVRLGEGRLTWKHLAALADALARFHAQAAASPAFDRYGEPMAIAENVRQNFNQAHAALAALVTESEQAEVEAWQLRFLETHAKSFERRIAAHKIRDGHGDLRLEHLYFDNAGHPLVIDCIEFNERFRVVDVCSDVAFLSMDLAWHGQIELKERFLARYARESHDYELYSVIDFYESYRAYVRAKVSVLTLDRPSLGVEARRDLEAAARRYFMLALASEHPRLEAPRLIAVGGIIASGKSTLAEALGERLAVPVIGSDRTRKALLGVSATAPLHAGAFDAAYSAERSAEVHLEVARLARVVVGSGRSVIIDASFRSVAQRAAIRELARELGVRFSFVECRAIDAVSRERLEQRAQSANVSDGRLEIFDAFVQSYEPVLELTHSEHVVVDTSGSVESVLDALLQSFPA